jgi:hypothetical protein
MATGAEGQARLRGKYLRMHAEGVLTANELFPALLDTFTEAGIDEELGLAGADVRGQMMEFLATHHPATFVPFVFGPPPTAAEAERWEQERQRKYAALLVALGIRAPNGSSEFEGRA